MADKLRFEDIIGVIFDINGTMFFDSEKHIRAWNQYVHELTGVELSPKGIQRYIINKSPKEILEHFLGGELSAETIEQLSDEKESIYRQLCRADEKNLRLAPGLEKFLDFLAENNVPRTIATTASASNVMFYFEQFDLYRWFEPDKVVYKNEKLREKPFPDMYLVACKLIDKEPKSCLVFEDSMSGIKAAVAAGIKNIVAVKGDNPELDTDKIEEVRVTIDDYTQLNETITVENFSDRYDNKNFNKTK